MIDWQRSCQMVTSHVRKSLLTEDSQHVFVLLTQATSLSSPFRVWFGIQRTTDPNCFAACSMPNTMSPVTRGFPHKSLVMSKSFWWQTIFMLRLFRVDIHQYAICYSSNTACGDAATYPLDNLCNWPTESHSPCATGLSQDLVRIVISQLRK